MKHILCATLFALILSGCQHDYTCKVIENANKKVDELITAIKDEDKEKSLRLHNELEIYFVKDWPTHGKSLNCETSEGEKTIEFSQKEKDDHAERMKKYKVKIDRL